ncbi:hypothetical protein [Photobacterium toruni]|uniref:Uncharacterized protein n=1 Tax=Photobacterium toruni TaxID=1935446 RepID=A0A1T4UJH6_9GAMM|nr:hypothetical protein [Photobacterium toruni]SKA52750.1 hypothetical protein CZ814_03341 [Photobacterium toruni]
MAANEAFVVTDVIVPVVTALCGAGMWSFFIKIRDKRLDDLRADELIVKGATSLVELQNKLMEQLQKDLERRLTVLEKNHREQLESERAEWDKERQVLKKKISDLSKRLKNLETEKAGGESDLNIAPSHVEIVVIP